MAPGYPSQGNYYDPTNSRAHNQQSYSYQDRTNATPQYTEPSASSNAQNAGYPNSYGSTGSYRAYYGADPQSSSTETGVAETLSNLSAQNNAHYGATGRNTATPAYDTTHRGSTQQTPQVNAQSRNVSHTSEPTIRSTSSNQAKSTYGQSSSTSAYGTGSTFRASDVTASYGQPSYNGTAQYGSAPTQTHTTSSTSNTHPQQRTNSPYQQAQRPPTTQPTNPKSKRATASTASNNHVRNDSDVYNRQNTVTPSSIQQQARRAESQTASVESLGPVTVDPTQVYDPWPEQQRRAQQAAEQRKKAEAEKARKEAERAEQQRKAKAAADQAANEQALQDAQSLEAARSLTMAAISEGAASGTQMESQMRAMFAKMREFNQMDPALLARLWEEERIAHVATQSPSAEPPAVSAAQQASASPAVTTPVPTKAKAKTKKASTKSPKAPAATASEPKTAKLAKSTKSASVPGDGAPGSQTALVQESPVALAAPSSSVWPSGKKVQIGEAAAKWLSDKVENMGKIITSDTIISLLHSNPSYTSLCESLERMGIFVDRPAFARGLLRAVPDINKSSQPAANSQAAIHPEQSLLKQGGTTPIIGSATTVSDKAKPIKASIKRGSAVKDTSKADKAKKAQKAPAESQVSISTPTTSQNVPASGFLSLAEMYRSATNLNLMNGGPVQHESPILTQPPNQASDPKSATPTSARPIPQNKEEAARKRNFSELVDLTAGDDSDKDDYPPRKMPNTSQFPTLDDTTMMTPLTLVDEPNQVDGAEDKMDQRLPASRPGMQMKTVEVRGKNLVSPILRHNVARKSKYDPRTIARDVLLATGRHPEMRALNQHLMGMQQLLFNNNVGVELHKYDLASIRWDLIDPGQPQQEIQIVEKSDEESDADDEDDDIPAPALSSRQAVGSGDGTLRMVEVATPMTNLKGMGSIKKGRGRPPRQSMPAMQMLAGGFGNTPGGQRPPPSDPRYNRQAAGQGRPAQGTPTQSGRNPAASGASGSQGSYSGIGYSAFRNTSVQLDENGNPIKKRGRPVGWRKAIHSKEANGLVPSDQVKPRPKQPKQSQAGPASGPEPDFKVYACKWEQCGAELHNLETLRKHVIKIHGEHDPDRRFGCKWNNCTLPQESDSKGKAPADTSPAFINIHHWINHIEKQHLLLLARSLGDGPRGGLSDAYDSERSEAYLSDAAGRMITPRSTPMENLDEDEAQQSQVLAPVLRRGMPRVRGKLSEEQREDELKLQQLEAKKFTLGPGLDSGGVRLATEERRKGFYDDEEFEGDVSPDDGPE